jgi:hypothetical protein
MQSQALLRWQGFIACCSCCHCYCCCCCCQSVLLLLLPPLPESAAAVAVCVHLLPSTLRWPQASEDCMPALQDKHSKHLLVALVYHVKYGPNTHI